MSDRLFQDRQDAGRVLAGLLANHRDTPDVIVVGLPRGGVPVAYEIAMALDAPLDVFLVRKLGVPGREELAMGAIAGGGVLVLNEDVIQGMGISPEVVQQTAEREGRELLRREKTYREGRPQPDFTGKTVIVVDDGLATGASMRAAVEALRRHRPAKIVVAVPAAPESTCREIGAMGDELVCASTPSPFLAVGRSYGDFAQTTDEEVRDLLRAVSRSRSAGAGSRDLAEAADIRSEALPTEEGMPREADLFELVGDARFVLIGEASHGTHEFYEARARMTRRLIEELGFCAVAVEADWADAYRVNRYVHGRGGDATAEEALRGFDRFPAWMWRNTVVADFAGWLREHNDRAGRDERAKVGFHGLDLYGLYRSAQEVVAFLERVDPRAAARARERYACFDHHTGGDGRSYGFAAAFGAGEPCERQAVEQLADLRRHALEYIRRDGILAQDELFHAEQSARAVKAAEAYYRMMFSEKASSWNLRVRHMACTLDSLAEHLARRRARPSRIVVWAHNTHVGDAQVTEAAARGELSLGRLVRERYPGQCRLIGFTTYTGTVTAADDWGGPAERKRVLPALPGSAEALLHEAGKKEFLLSFGVAPRAFEALRPPRLERAIGVVYRPRTERRSHYLHARVAEQFDAVIHIDETRAVEPLERTAGWTEGEIPDTYPIGL
ncbi:erythromycin esterase family protein [Streptosporangium lutulentum]|uniref:Erythromycin esterase-like protein/predicted phosphoribosyltransferase n=1 Tax=Streptosporangium lutulentum TaxID=1461250 RepID=A0ABT9Q2U0_9ACTN|nr:erythromycin esterase family protein [Streptosporangium lutulentum]MDP9841048.1 erythromycin esterase-like protein/predicted phosphoribosyltransferase [Streptosporangium lutulentum]